MAVKKTYTSVAEQATQPTLAKLDVATTENTKISSIVFVNAAEMEQLPDATIVENASMFADWVENVDYTLNDIRKENSDLYRCVQSHTSQAGWEPSNTPALWTMIGDITAEYPAWTQPIGAFDAYAIDAKCSHNGDNWVSIVDNNVWEPGVYGWEVVVDVDL